MGPEPQLFKLEKPISGVSLWSGNFAAAGKCDVVGPITEARMAEYKQSGHDRYSLDEVATKFSAFALCETSSFLQPRFWVRSCIDGFERVWDMVAGKGQTNMFNDMGDKIWMHGELNMHRHAPRDLITRDFPEYTSRSGEVN